MNEDAASENVMSDIVTRRSYWLSSSGADLMTHAHLPQSKHCTTAVLICGSIGYEATHAYRCLIRLADELAANGIAAFRFDYVGTGNSALDASHPDLVEHWQQNITDQVRHLRDEWGFSTVSIVAFRFGAVLTSSLLTSLDIKNFTLWEPVTKGKSFVRELRAAAQFSKDPSVSAEESLESGGFVYSDETIKDLSALSLCSNSFGADFNTLLVSRGPVAKLTADAASIGFQLEEVRNREFDKMVCEPHFTKLPVESIARIADWHSRRRCATHSNIETPALRTTASLRDKIIDRPIIETIFRGEKDNLFGIVTQPDNSKSTGKMTVVLPNAGSVSCIGPNRVYVQTARALALSGFVTVRFDLRNLGDSVVGDVADANFPYPESVGRDVSSILQFLRAKFSLGPFALAGLCSGAHAAYRYGLTTADTDVNDLILVNPLTYYWKPGTSLSNPMEHRTVRDAKTYVRSAQNSRNWHRLLTGKINYRRLLSFAVKMLLRTLSNLAKSASTLWSRASLTRMDKELLLLKERGKHVAFLFSDSDPGYWIAKADSPRTFKTHEDREISTVRFIEDADHTMSKAKNRDDLIAMLKQHLEKMPAN